MPASSPTAAAPPLKIFGVPFSVHTRKVIVAARLKSIPYEVVPVVPVIPDNPPANWRDISPTGLIPAIDDDGFVLCDSTAIVLYFERRVAEPALLPADARDYGRALSLDAWAGSALFRRIVHPIFHHQVVSPQVHGKPGEALVIEQALTRAAPEAFDYLERLSPQRFLVGQRLSIADLAVVSNLLVLGYLGHRVDSARFPRLAAYFRKHLELPALKAVLRAERPFVEKMGLDSSFID